MNKCCGAEGGRGRADCIPPAVSLILAAIFVSVRLLFPHRCVLLSPGVRRIYYSERPGGIWCSCKPWAKLARQTERRRRGGKDKHLRAQRVEEVNKQTSVPPNTYSSLPPTLQSSCCTLFFLTTRFPLIDPDDSVVLED